MKYIGTLLLVLLLVLTPAVSAELIINKYTNDFAASSPYNEQLKLCGCETKVDTIIVENTGTFHTNFRVDVKSDYPRQIRIPEQNFELPPKHFKEVLVYIEDSCGVQGTYVYDVEITNSYGRSEIIHRTVDVQRCQTASLEVLPYEQTVGLCDPITYDVTVRNVGTYQDAFTLDFGQYNEFAEVPMPAVLLNPDQEFEQTVTFTFPCEEYGVRTIPFYLWTDKNGLGAETYRDVTIENEYNFGLNLETEFSACADTVTSIPFTIDNGAHVPDSVTVDVLMPAFVSFAEGRSQTVHLEGNEEAELSLVVSPGRASIGEHNLMLRAHDTHGNIVKEREAHLTVNNCFDVDLDFRIDTETSADLPVVSCCGQETFYANIRNDGDREQVFHLVIDGPSFFTLDETSVRVQPNQNINVPIRADLPCTDQTYEAKVIAYPVGYDALGAEDNFVVESLTQRTCHMVQIDDDEVVIREDAVVVPVIVRHTGVAGGVYNVNMESELFSVEEESLEIYPGERKVIHLMPSVDLASQAKGRYILEPQFTLEPLSINYNEHVGLELLGKSVWQRMCDWFTGLPWQSVTVCVWLLFLLLVLLILCLIALFGIYSGNWELYRHGLPRFTLVVVKTILLLLLLVLLVGFAFLSTPGEEYQYEKAAENVDATVIEWYQNHQNTLNLDLYFEDPDMDELTYTATQSRDIKVSIVDNMMTLTPDHNFAGENTLVVTASDNKGGLTDSPVFLLRVIPKKYVSFVEWLNLWCSFIKLLLVIGITLVLFLMVLTIREERPNDPHKNVLVVVPRKKTAKRKAPKKKASVKKAAVKKVAKKRAKVRFYSSKTGTKAHRANCMALNNVKAKNRRVYKSKTAVLNAGLALCSMCMDAPIRKAGQVATKNMVGKPGRRKAVLKKVTTGSPVKKVARKTTRKKARKATRRKVNKRKPVRKKAATRKRSRKVVKKVNKRKPTRKVNKRKPVRKKSTRKSSRKAVRKISRRKVVAVPVKKGRKIRKKGTKSSKDSQMVNVQINIKK